MADADFTIMILDDDEAIRESFGDYFEDQGFQVQLMNSAEAALASLHGRLFDVVIVDIRLGGMPGDEFIRRAHAGCDRCGFIICTGSPAYHLPDSLKHLERVSSTIFQKPLEDLGELHKEAWQLADRLQAKLGEA
jgi:DNA-binding NtrC family response regulator